MCTTLTYEDRYQDWESREILPQVQEDIEFETLVRLLEGSTTKQQMIFNHIHAGMFTDKTNRAIFKMIESHIKQNGYDNLNAYNLILNTDDKLVIYTQYLQTLKNNYITDKDSDNWVILLQIAYKKRTEKECHSLEESDRLKTELQKLQLKTTEINLKNVSMRYLLDYEEVAKSMVKTFYPSIDALIGGIQGGNLVLLAGATGAGKTCAMLNLVIKMAKHNKKVLLFSLEMNADELLSRIIAIEAGINSENMRNRNLTPGEMDKYVSYSKSKVFEELQKNISIHTNFDITVEDISTTVHNSKAAIVIVDYLGLIKGNSNQNSYERVSSISRSLKILANSSNKPIIALHQLNRSPKDRADKHPTLSDLRDSGKLEQDADTICFVYRPAYYDSKASKTAFEFIVAKSRHTGGAGKIANLIFTGAYQRLTDPLGESKEEIKQCTMNY